MPLTEKGQKIMSAMKQNYGPDRGEEVFYASKNAGAITGVDMDEFMPGELPRREEEKDAGALFPAEVSVRRPEEEDAGALLAASGSPGGPIGGGRRDNVPWRGGGLFGARDWKETYTLENSSDDEYATPGISEQQPQPQPQQQQAPSTGDQPEMQELRKEDREEDTDCADQQSIGVLPGGLPEGTLEHPQEWPGESAPPQGYHDQVGGMHQAFSTGGDPPPPRSQPARPFEGSSPFHPAYGVAGDAVVGYGGIAGGVFKQDWGDAPHPFADQLPGGMTTNEIQNWGQNHYWRQWEK